MTLEEKIALMLQEEESLNEAKKTKMEADEEELEADEDEVEIDPKMKKKDQCDEEAVEVTAEDAAEAVAEETSAKASVSEQVSALLSAEGLSEEFRTQAVAIFEAAVADRVLQVKAELQEQFEADLNTAKEALAESVDGYLTEQTLNWASENKVPLIHSFKADLAESFIDGLRSLFVEHNVNIPEESEDALTLALESNDKLEEQLAAQAATAKQLQEEINTMKKAQILESAKSSMTVTEADRFDALVESIKFESSEQYSKQLDIIKENFSVKKSETKPVSITESIVAPKVTDTAIAQYASFFSKNK